MGKKEVEVIEVGSLLDELGDDYKDAIRGAVYRYCRDYGVKISEEQAVGLANYLMEVIYGDYSEE